MLRLKCPGVLRGVAIPQDIKEPEPKPDPEPEDLAAPANLVAQDYWGPTGDGDQGGYIMVSFPSSEGAMDYQLWREIQVNTRLDSAGMAEVADTSSGRVDKLGFDWGEGGG